MWSTCSTISKRRRSSLLLQFRNVPSYYLIYCTTNIDNNNNNNSTTRCRRCTIITSKRTSTSNAIQNTTGSKNLGWYVDPITGHIQQRKHPNNNNNNNVVVPLSYQVIVGLEIHVQLNHCSTKLFSAGKLPSSQQQQQQQHQTVPPPNTIPSIHPYDVGVPGILPLLSISAVRYAILMAGILHCNSIHTISRFERKHYTYSDLPHSYQLTQQRWPIATNGLVQCEYQPNSNKTNNNNNNKKMIQCRINRIQLEQDTAKTTSITKKIKTKKVTTLSNATSTEVEPEEMESLVTFSRIDMNRAGIPLCEIVTEPDLRSAKEASTFVQHVRQLIQYTNISSALMQHGQLRVDCNVNIIPISNQNLDESYKNIDDIDSNDSRRYDRKHPRVEVKNLNSIQQIEDCIQYEAYRQVQILEELHQHNYQNSDDDDHQSALPSLLEETRTYNALTKRTELLRYKDQQNDYRFLPEMDLPPCIINRTVLQDCTTIQEYIHKYTPTLPYEIQYQLVHGMGLSPELAQVLVTHHPTAVQYFRQALLYAITMMTDVEVVSKENPHDAMAVVSHHNDEMETKISDLLLQSLSLEEIALRYSHNKTRLQRIAGEVANLQCNVLFHVVKEEYRSKLLLQEQQQHSVWDGGDSHEEHITTTDGLGLLSMDHCPITARQLGEIVQMLLNEQISNTMAKQLIQILCSTEYHNNATTTNQDDVVYISPREVANARNIKLMTNSDELRQICTDVMLNHPDEVQVYHRGGKYKMKMEKLFIGKVMSVTHGNAHPERLRDIVIECLSSSSLPS